MKRDVESSTRSACDDARLEASAWIDGELADDATLSAHLAQCADCRAHVDELRAWKRRLAPLRDEDSAADLWPRLAARAANAAQVSTARPSYARRAAAALVGFVGTAALLQAAAGFFERNAAEPPRRIAWPAGLHQESADALRLAGTPEQQLLAALQFNPMRQR